MRNSKKVNMSGKGIVGLTGLERELSWEALCNIQIGAKYRLGNDILFLEDVDIVEGLPPYFRVGGMMALLLEKGIVRAQVNMRTIVARAPCLIILRAHEYVEVTDFRQNVRAKALFFSEEFTAQLNMKPNYELMQAVTRRPVVRLAPPAKRIILLYCEMLKTLLQTDTPFISETAINLTRALVFGIGHDFYMRDAQPTNASRSEQIVHQFFDCVREYCKEERGIAFYASQLCTTAKYLSTIIRQHTGKTPHEWITEYVILEAKMLLTTTDMTSAQIANILKFGSPSLFGKYFKRVVGITPQVFRSSGAGEQRTTDDLHAANEGASL